MNKGLLILILTAHNFYQKSRLNKWKCAAHKMLFVEFYVLACEKGYFYDAAERRCTICPIETYSDTTTAESCTYCRGHLTTQNTGSTSYGQCGKYSEFWMLATINRGSNKKHLSNSKTGSN